VLSGRYLLAVLLNQHAKAPSVTSQLMTRPVLL